MEKSAGSFRERSYMNKKVKRGQIYRVNLDPVVGSEQGGIRPMLIVQTDGFNKSSTTVIAMAITSKFNKRRDLATHVIVRCNELPHDSIVLAEQIRTLDKSRLVEYIGRASNNTMKRVDHAIDVIMKTKTKHNGYKSHNPNERR